MLKKDEGMIPTFLECIKWLYNSDWRGVNLQQTTSTIYKINKHLEVVELRFKIHQDKSQSDRHKRIKSEINVIKSCINHLLDKQDILLLI